MGLDKKLTKSQHLIDVRERAVRRASEHTFDVRERVVSSEDRSQLIGWCRPSLNGLSLNLNKITHLFSYLALAAASPQEEVPTDSKQERRAQHLSSMRHMDALLHQLGDQGNSTKTQANFA